jgi:penicillin-binding protein 1A
LCPHAIFDNLNHFSIGGDIRPTICCECRRVGGARTPADRCPEALRRTPVPVVAGDAGARPPAWMDGMTVRSRSPRSGSERLVRRPRAARLLRLGMVFLSILLVAGMLAATGFYHYINEELPRISTLSDYRPPIISSVYADDGRKIGEFAAERRIVIPLGEMPENLINAFVAAEDSRFWKHPGIDVVGILRAFFKNLEAGTIVQGGSTITQQVTKSFFLTPEKKYIRKIKEAILAYRIDKTFSKADVLFLYLNQIYLGHGAYGVEAAAENYFGKRARQLTLAECAVLAGLPQAPSRYSPYSYPERARQRQVYVLNRMSEDGYINATQMAEALAAPLVIAERRDWAAGETPFYLEHVRRVLESKYGVDALYRDGLQIHTAVNLEMQQAAAAAVDLGLRELDKRQGYRGPLQRLKPSEGEPLLRELERGLSARPLAPGVLSRALVTAVDPARGTVQVALGAQRGVIPPEGWRWARRLHPDAAKAMGRRASEILAAGDVVWVRIEKAPAQEQPWPVTLEQTPVVQGALLCLEAGSGRVKAMIGGRDFAETQFNRAIQSRRQPGSAFKPLIFAAALDRGPTPATGARGYTPATIIIDAPIAFQGSEADSFWKPKNYKNEFYGPTPMREALAQSRNIVTIKILSDIGVDYAIDYARRLGIASNLHHDLSIALGSSGVSLLELVGAYAVFANAGERVEPVFITRILDRDGKVLEEAQPERQQAIAPSTAYLMTSMLESVVKEGTGRRVAALGRPAAGKTGTTNELNDAWFVGYTPRLVAGAWVGFDEESPLGREETGASAASPIWLAFMQKTLENAPVELFPVPDGVVFTRIDTETGLLPTADARKTLFECFKEGTAPTESSATTGMTVDAETFFKSSM